MPVGRTQTTLTPFQLFHDGFCAHRFCARPDTKNEVCLHGDLPVSDPSSFSSFDPDEKNTLTPSMTLVIFELDGELDKDCVPLILQTLLRRLSEWGRKSTTVASVLVPDARWTLVSLGHKSLSGALCDGRKPRHQAVVACMLRRQSDKRHTDVPSTTNSKTPLPFLHVDTLRESRRVLHPGESVGSLLLQARR
jgi:hypothetical protein